MGRKHVLSIMVMVNEKFNEDMQEKWKWCEEEPKKFQLLFQSVLNLPFLSPLSSPSVGGKEGRKGERRERGEGEGLTLEEKMIFIQFLGFCFQSLENDLVRGCCLGLVGLRLWWCFGEERRELELKGADKLRKGWKGVAREMKKLGISEGFFFFLSF